MLTASDYVIVNNSKRRRLDAKCRLATVRPGNILAAFDSTVRAKHSDFFSSMYAMFERFVGLGAIARTVFGRRTITKFAVISLVCSSFLEVGCSKRDDFIDEFTERFPKAACSDETSQFRVCYRVTKEQCEATAKSAALDCATRQRSSIPDFLAWPADHSKWGSILGACSGAKYDDELANLHASTNACAQSIARLKGK